MVAGVSIWQILVLLIILGIGMLPWIMALASKKADGINKVLWFLMSFFLSWLGYLIYYYLVIKNPNSQSLKIK